MLERRLASNTTSTGFEMSVTFRRNGRGCLAVLAHANLSNVSVVWIRPVGATVNLSL